MGMLVFGVLLVILSFVMGSALKSGNIQSRIGNLAVTGGMVRIVGILLVLIGTISSAIITVPAGSCAVLLRFRAVAGSYSSGIHLIIPYINTTEIMETRTQKEVAKGTAASRDLQMVTAEVAINYHISEDNAADLYKNVGLDYKSRIIDPAVQESLKQVTAQYTAEDLIKRRSEVKTKVESEITSRLKVYEIIVEPLGVSITNFDFSPEFNAAIEQKQVAQQTAEKQKYVLQQAVLEKQTEITKAEGQAQASKIRALALKTQGGSRVIAEKWIDRWDGKLPQVTSGSNMMINLSELLRGNESKPNQ